MNRKKLLISLAMAMLSMAGLAADNLPALRVEGRNRWMPMVRLLSCMA